MTSKRKRRAGFRPRLGGPGGDSRWDTQPRGCVRRQTSQQSFGIDRGVALRGGKTGVAQQVLNGTQIGAARQQMRRERMPQARAASRARAGRSAGGNCAACAAPHRRSAARRARRRTAAHPGRARGAGAAMPPSPARTTGSTGTIRSFAPLPTTRSIASDPGSGASATLSASASAMRSPLPYSRLNSAASRACTIASSEASPMSCATARASCAESAFGSGRFARGADKSATCALFTPWRRASQRKKVRTADKMAGTRRIAGAAIGLAAPATPADRRRAGQRARRGRAPRRDARSGSR